MDDVGVDGQAYSAGQLLRLTRNDSGLSLRQLAGRAGTTHSTLAAYETGRKQPSLAVLERVLAAMGRQLALSTEPLHADVDRAIEQHRARPIAERLQHLPFHAIGMADKLDGVRYVVTGLAAALMHGAPVPVSEFTITVPDDDAVLTELASRLRWTYVFDPASKRNNPAPAAIDSRVGKLRELTPSRWSLPAEGDLVVTVGALPPSVEIVCDQTTFAVCAIDDVDATDPRAARVLARLRAGTTRGGLA